MSAANREGVIQSIAQTRAEQALQGAGTPLASYIGGNTANQTLGAKVPTQHAVCPTCHRCPTCGQYKAESYYPTPPLAMKPFEHYKVTWTPTVVGT